MMMIDIDPILKSCNNANWCFYGWIWPIDILFTVFASVFIGELIYNFLFLLSLWDFGIRLC